MDNTCTFFRAVGENTHIKRPAPNLGCEGDLMVFIGILLPKYDWVAHHSPSLILQRALTIIGKSPYFLAMDVVSSAKNKVVFTAYFKRQSI